MKIDAKTPGVSNTSVLFTQDIFPLLEHAVFFYLKDERNSHHPNPEQDPDYVNLEVQRSRYESTVIPGFSSSLFL